MILALVLAATVDLRLELIRESLTGTHYRYRQYVDGEAVIGSEVNVTSPIALARAAEWRTDNPVCPDVTNDRQDCLSSTNAPLVHRGAVVWARRELVRVDDVRSIVRYLDLETGAVLREDVPFAHDSKAARVFDPNPVAKLNDPSLQDANDSASAVPVTAYSDVILERLNESGPLAGTYVRIVDVQAPAVPPADASASLLFDRDANGFEDVSAYFHIDRSQAHLQSLGYSGGRTVAPYAIEVDAHAINGRDDSFFVASASAGRGSIFLGEGGTDDAEDSDLLVHEYAHAIHEWISPGTFLGSFGSQGRAISEGFGDYWSFSAHYDASVASGRDPFCFADWDARCAGDAPSEGCAYPPGADCLRRVDSTKTMADYSSSDASGTEHRNGQIWSSALREIFMAIGRKSTDTIVVESFFGTPPNPSFAGMALRMIAADQLLYGGANRAAICAAMTGRAILAECAALPRGEITLFQSTEQGLPIPDNNAAGVTLSLTISDSRPIETMGVNVNIVHTLRGDLRIVLIAPDGSETVLQNISGDRGRDFNVTYGRDALPAEPLGRFRGQSAAGVWRLRVSDVRAADTGSVISWGLAIQFAGDTPSASRPSTGEKRQIIAAAGHVPGANGTFWVTDVRLFAARETTATLIFTPSGQDGRNTFASVKVHVPAASIVALNDVVAATLGTSGTGQIEIQGEVVATSRTFTRDDSGSYGQSIEPVPADHGARFAELLPIDSNGTFRTNVGVAETAGESGRVRIRIFGAACGEVASADYHVTPFSHLQVPVSSAVKVTVEVTTGSARIIAYASVIDNRSGDPTYFAARQLRGIAPAIRSGGALGTTWHTAVSLGASATLRYASITASRGYTAPEPCGARSADALRELLDIDESRGVISGALFTQRIYTTGPRGTYGQSVPLAEPYGGSRDILHIESSRQFRTNLGIVTGSEAAIVRLIVLDAAGRELARSEHPLSSGSLEQFTLQQPVTNGRVHVEVLSGSAYVYASIVDNQSGDPIFVPAQ